MHDKYNPQINLAYQRSMRAPNNICYLNLRSSFGDEASEQKACPLRIKVTQFNDCIISLSEICSCIRTK
jgi:hypothetical protein